MSSGISMATFMTICLLILYRKSRPARLPLVRALRSLRLAKALDGYGFIRVGPLICVRRRPIIVVPRTTIITAHPRRYDDMRIRGVGKGGVGEKSFEGFAPTGTT